MISTIIDPKFGVDKEVPLIRTSFIHCNHSTIEPIPGYVWVLSRISRAGIFAPSEVMNGNELLVYEGQMEHMYIGWKAVGSFEGRKEVKTPNP